MDMLSIKAIKVFPIFAGWAGILFICTLVLGCFNGVKNNTVTFSYSDFGPQVIAHEVIGMEWWQWQDHGDSRPRDYDVKVVVYRNATLDEVKIKFPVVAEQLKDYRYLEYDVAINFLNEKIDENILEAVTVDLKKTRQKLVNVLGD